MTLQQTLDVTPAQVKQAMAAVEEDYRAQLRQLAVEYKSAKAAVRKQKGEQLKYYRRLLDAIEAEPGELPDATEVKQDG